MNKLNTAGDYQHPLGLTAQVFLAYAAEDCPRFEGDGQALPGQGNAATVNALRQLLTTAQIPCWEFPRPWPSAVDPEAAMSRATEGCDNYLLVLSPHCLADALCLQGLLFALSLNKRIVPVLAEAVPMAHLPEPLQTLAAIDLRTAVPPLKQTSAGRQILKTLRHEASYHRAHTQLLVKALQWERQLRDPTLLLRGNELADYQRWVVRASGRSRHQFIYLQVLYVAESARQWSNRQGNNGSDFVPQGIGWLKHWVE
ncbi:toll/interleukin-1 receptor domain-containing protein [Nodosilinea nodulosa]|uniref:toll/interleukin-1 receptor domain-containing protein n=1 Tax=Nodosilinea nodulosa TaxID=416001 RepID=UPI000365011D|nr:toll/interleukin-1 receptor domain-containing protein [Nodosilinea nodulosa]